MNYLLDTYVCVSYLRGRNSTNIETRMAAALPGEVALCSVVKAELLFGAERSQFPQKNRKQLEHFFAPFPSLPFDDPAAAVYGAVRTNLETQGTSIGPDDLMIASIALAGGWFWSRTMFRNSAAWLASRSKIGRRLSC